MHTGDLFASARIGAIAQLGERLLCKHQVVGSIPTGSTSCLQTQPFMGATAAGGSHGNIRNNQVLLLVQVHQGSRGFAKIDIV